jgi:hypothetical protein
MLQEVSGGQTTQLLADMPAPHRVVQAAGWHETAVHMYLPYTSKQLNPKLLLHAKRS